ncbi:MAG: DUF5658 family protein [Acidobacteriia bacterium]|nr:DUF5658 family protein [Terriglobia bacterium]
MFRSAIIASIALAGLTLFTVPAIAADGDSAAATTGKATATTPPATSGLAGDVDWSLPPIQIGAATTRPAALSALYVSLAGLQAFDGYSTLQGVSRNAREGNALMQGAASHPAAFFAVKAVSAAVPMIIAERMWRTNRVGAIVVMVLANGVAGAVAANNAHALHQQQ